MGKEAQHLAEAHGRDAQMFVQRVMAMRFRRSKAIRMQNTFVIFPKLQRTVETIRWIVVVSLIINIVKGLGSQSVQK